MGLLLKYNTTPPDLNPETMEKYLAALKIQENEGKAGFKNGIWTPHKNAENGNYGTIAYGHKLTKDEGYLKKGISDEKAISLLNKDVLKHQKKAKSEIDSKYGEGSFDKLPQDHQMLLIDYVYNLGNVTDEFPSFTEGVMQGDKAKMLKEYVRKSNDKPLKKRNAWTEKVINDSFLDNSKTLLYKK
jgi:hypothetical protein